ncbi:MAG TPA: hypothetical protein VKR32_03195 [Puia sp.]|nr:hypothetical protein [Puia sp.]
MHFDSISYQRSMRVGYCSNYLVSASQCYHKSQNYFGEETGGNAHIISGDPAELILPETPIRSKISTTTFRIAKGFNNGHAVMPDYRIHPTANEFTKAKDPLMEFTMKLITKNQPH